MLILVGKSASGKTFIGKSLELRGFHKIVTYTTREKRPGEIDGKDYYFLSKAAFLAKIEAGFFFEYVNYNNNFYGTSKSSIGDKYSYLIVEPEGLKKYLRCPNVVTFFIDTPKEILKKRMLARGDKLKDIECRLENDEIIFNEDVKREVNYIIDGTEDIKLILLRIERLYNGCAKFSRRR